MITLKSKERLIPLGFDLKANPTFRDETRICSSLEDIFL